MQNKKYFSYIRVSTQKQGQFGTSLIEQKAAIESYASKFDLSISRHFEERETAAKQGRPVFLEMLRALKKGRANGVIIHKIDRTARNLKDWADFQSLTDLGIEIHFAAESLDLNSRGGRLSADIQAVVASDYIRNLREETKKGIYGRLKQGLYPFRAVIGYLDAGKGNPKKIDRIQGALVKQAFELYSRGNIGLIALADVMYEKDLHNKLGKKVTINGLSTILHNPFYTGIIRIEKTGELFAGKHKPLISRILFEQVQAVLEGRNIPKSGKHFFLFRRQVRCAKCGNLYTAERQKGEVYYRCHTKNCTRTTIREDLLEREVLEFLKSLELNERERQFFKQEILKQSENSQADFEANFNQLKLEQDLIASRLSKLADAYMDEIFDKETYINKKNKLLLEAQSVKEKLNNMREHTGEVAKKMGAFFELVDSAYLSYKSGNPEQKRELVKNVFSNCEVNEKNVLVKPFLPFQLIAERTSFTSGSPYREAVRTLAPIFQQLLPYFEKLDSSKNDDGFSKYINSKSELTSKESLTGY